MHESGGNPNAENDWDINAMNGDPSRGLFQTIGATFAAYALPGHNNILSPIDNSIAAIRYIQARYGSVFSVPGIVSLANGGSYVGYANGGIISEPITGIGLHTGTRYAFGERGPETVLPNGVSIGSSNIGTNSDNREILARLDQIASLLEQGLTLDGQRVTNALMPYVVNNIRNRVGGVTF
jgi:SLT domain-containing protein